MSLLWVICDFCDLSVAVTSSSYHSCDLCCAVGFGFNVADAKKIGTSYFNI